ncbi:hypothetical protein T552_02468 [Pneumocystis carinii B80]|uniref:TATA element modulatory factor 1 TATA binding domain-containing protein n=1 Tax=Pneumocystis carinii (strain B80) TaxID=1408658 RepID=A0A0W4ZF16_PNEC8|nr:hypothetical protein T552_02468 [Pneumocystis carinii B80]KTW26977.1 hypothetical protein T552_02468 [Pneumocystis carinii B80]
MWSDFLKKTINNVEQFKYDAKGLSNSLSSALEKSPTKSHHNSPRKLMQDRLVEIVSSVQNSGRFLESQSLIQEKLDVMSTYLHSIGLSQKKKEKKTEWCPVYETDEITENRCSLVFPASMPNTIKKEEINNVDLKKTGKKSYINTGESSVSSNEFVGLDIISLKHAIDEKDKKIQILLEEGEELSKKELKHLSIIRSLRSKIEKSEKDANEMKNKTKKMESELIDLKKKLKNVSENNKLLSNRLKGMSGIEKELDLLKIEQIRLENEKNNELKNLEDTTIAIKKTMSRQHLEELEIEKSKSCSLLDKLNEANINLSLLEEKSKSEINSLYSLLENERKDFFSKEKAYIEEISVLEGKIETLRYELEEVSHNANSSLHANLLQQNESLQTQYFTAFQNWNEEKSDMLTKNALLQEENEKYLKIINEETLKLKNMNEKMEKLEMTLFDNENILKDTKLLNESLAKKVFNLEETIVKINSTYKNELKELKLSFETQYKAEEKPKLIDDEIPLVNNNFDLQYKGHNISEHNELNSSILSNSMNDISYQRRHSSDLIIQNISPHLPTSSENYKNDNKNDNNSDAYFDNESVQSVPALPNPHLLNFSDNDTFMSKVGPNINIILQLSLSIQKLKSQLSMKRDEINQIIQQRDDARNECVQLMIQVEKNKELNNKIHILEDKLKELNERHEKCLELLGEKTEKEEELKHDIADMKKLYTQQIEELIAKFKHSQELK